MRSRAAQHSAVIDPVPAPSSTMHCGLVKSMSRSSFQANHDELGVTAPTLVPWRKNLVRNNQRSVVGTVRVPRVPSFS